MGNALYLEDEENSFFQAEVGREVRTDVPLVEVVRNAHDVSWLWRDRVPFGLVTLIEAGLCAGPAAGTGFGRCSRAGQIDAGQVDGERAADTPPDRI